MEGPPLDSEEFKRWRAAALQAPRSAELQRDGEIYNWACFSAEQGTQLAVKGLLHGVGGAPWGHDLRALVDDAQSAGLPASSLEAAARLTRHYIPSRYPDALPGGTAEDNYMRSDADDAIADAESIIAAVDVAWAAFVG